MEDMYVTLLPTSSVKQYPYNSLSSFTNILPKNLLLSGVWKVAISNYHLMSKYTSFNKKDSEFTITETLSPHSPLYQARRKFHITLISNATDYEGEKEGGRHSMKVSSDGTIIVNVKLKIPLKFYRNNADVVEAIGDVISSDSIAKALLSVSLVSNKVVFKILSGDQVEDDAMTLHFSTKVEKTLGMKRLNGNSIPAFKVVRENHIPDTMIFMETDIVDYSTFGSSVRQCIRSIRCPYVEGDLERRIDLHDDYYPRQYYVVSPHELREISIRITDSVGDLLCIEEGECSVTLHLIKISDE